MPHTMRITVDVDVPFYAVEDPATLSKDLVDQLVKVKSGQFENIAIGYISEAVFIKSEHDEFDDLEEVYE